MLLPVRKLIFAMVNSKVFVTNDGDQPFVTAPPIRMDRRAGHNMSPDDVLQRGGLCVIWHNLYVGLFMQLCGASTNRQVNAVDRSHREPGQFSRAHRSEIQCKISHQVPEFGFTDFRTAIVPILLTISLSYHIPKCV